MGQPEIWGLTPEKIARNRSILIFLSGFLQPHFGNGVVLHLFWDDRYMTGLQDGHILRAMFDRGGASPCCLASRWGLATAVNIARSL